MSIFVLNTSIELFHHCPETRGCRVSSVEDKVHDSCFANSGGWHRVRSSHMALSFSQSFIKISVLPFIVWSNCVHEVFSNFSNNFVGFFWRSAGLKFLRGFIEKCCYVLDCYSGHGESLGLNGKNYFYSNKLHQPRGFVK